MALILGEWRDSRDPVSGAFAEHCQAESKRDELREALEILRGRFLRIRPSERNRYTPEERFRIVVYVQTHSLSHAEAADLFLVDPGTIGRWMREAIREPDKETIGSLVKATPPLRSTHDVAVRLVALLDQMHVGGSKRIAQMLARAGTKIGTETVRRLRTMKSVPPPPREDRIKSTAPLALRANEPNHVWMTDITTVPSLLRIRNFKLVVILDVFARFPLAFKVFAKEPASEDIAALVRSAAERFGKPKHFVTDRGSQFTGGPFTSLLTKLGVRQRFGAVGRTGSIAIIERFWRTLKELIDSRFMPPLSLGHLGEKVELAIFYYATLRPHQGLNAATPAEMYFGKTPQNATAIREPPGSAREPPTPDTLPFEVAWCDRNRRMPFLLPVAA